MILPFLLFAAGSVALSIGAALVYRPAGVIVLGAALIYLSVKLASANKSE